jgi:translation initiation factor 2-alpha kinase 4
MPPPGKKPVRKTTDAFPVLHTDVNEAPKSPYEETQEDELIALASIYGEDFRRIATHHSAWKVRSMVNQMKD